MSRPWRTNKFLPSTTTLRLLSVSTTEAGVLVEAEGQSSAPCPSCGRRSHARHSHYWRTLKDLALQGQPFQFRTRLGVQYNRSCFPHEGMYATDTHLVSLFLADYTSRRGSTERPPSLGCQRPLKTQKQGSRRQPQLKNQLRKSSRTAGPVFSKERRSVGHFPSAGCTQQGTHPAAKMR
jgi:hypothetical protein